MTGAAAEVRRKPTRAEKNARTRAALLAAAARIVGGSGYAAASVAEITRDAGVALGTFYNHFDSREDLLDQLLPDIGQQMLEFVQARRQGIEDPLAEEEAGFRAFFDFLQQRPEFYRILYEAETFAPDAFERHVARTRDGYVRVLRRALARRGRPLPGELELEALSQMLLGVRHFVAMRYARDGDGARAVPEEVIAAYMRLVRSGLGI
ncbi:MAG: TetR/AcrR family transcriptional regulator [Pseudomonadota bacterium]|nr:TetR/AcrR family transcriptional regulator [Pseudomonadota bacterium]